MSIPVSLRGDFKASQLRALARRTKDGPQARRLLTLAAIYDGTTRTEAAKIGGVTLQIIWDWVMRFNARGASGLLDGKSPGQPTRLNDCATPGDCADHRFLRARRPAVRRSGCKIPVHIRCIDCLTDLRDIMVHEIGLVLGRKN